LFNLSAFSSINIVSGEFFWQITDERLWNGTDSYFFSIC